MKTRFCENMLIGNHLVDDKSSLVFAHYGRFAHGLAKLDGGLRRLSRGVGSADHLEEFHNWYRVEEVQPYKPVFKY